MKRFIFGLCIFLVTVSSASGQAAKHVILISIDGFRPDFYLDESWHAPNLRKLLQTGVSATSMRTVVPSVTYPSHTTLVTGAMPGRHGIYYNALKDSTGGQWYWEESYIKTPMLWDAVKSSGLTSAAVMWPVTAGAPIDYNFPVRRPNKGEGGDQLNVTRPLVTPPGLLDEIEKANHTQFTKADFSHERMDKTIAMMTNHILSRHKPHLMAVHFLSMDHAGHAFGRRGAHIQESLTLVDSLVGAIVSVIDKAGMKEHTAIIITGDHGMVERTTGLAPNVWLARNGLHGKNNSAAKFHPAGGSAFLYLKDTHDEGTLRKVNAILTNLPASEKKLFRVVSRHELDEMGANPEPALALAFSKGVVFHDAVDGAPVRSVKAGGTHGYFPDFPEIMTGFIATGAGINHGVRIREIGVQDIAPLVARLLAMDFHSPDGKLHPEILKK
jgi:predicted AlkP superfamily pyrophosphatase or phosphodiesterase